MNPGTFLTSLLGLKGVEAAALVTPDGDTVLGKSRSGGGATFPRGLITSVLASANALSGLLGGEEFGECLLEFERGPVIVAPLPEQAAPGYVAVLALGAEAVPGRVRHQLRGILGRLKGS